MGLCLRPLSSWTEPDVLATRLTEGEILERPILVLFLEKHTFLSKKLSEKQAATVRCIWYVVGISYIPWAQWMMVQLQVDITK